MTIIVDDHLLVDVLAGRMADVVREESRDEAIFTTGCWFYRIARAAGGSGTGTLSRRVAQLPPDDRRRVLSGPDDLPPEVGLLSFRVLVRVMQALRVQRPLNILNAEALAAAVVLDAPLVASVDLGRAENLGARR